MKMCIIKKVFAPCTVGIILLLFAVACEKDPTADFNNGTPDQLFRPVGVVSEVEGNSVVLSWVPIKNASYELDLSKDNLLFTTDLKSYTIKDSARLTVENLWSNTLYSVRIKAVSNDPGIKDSGYELKTFTTGTENIFFSVAAEDIGTDQILLKWIKSKEVTHIVVSAAGASDRTIQLSDSDKLAGEMLIDGLSGNTVYAFTIYLDEMPRGMVTVTTN